MKKQKTILYDDALIKKERGVKIANAVLLVLFLIYFIPMLFVAYKTESLSGILLPTLLYIVLAQVNGNYLKHIDSIKLYRKEIERNLGPLARG